MAPRYRVDLQIDLEMEIDASDEKELERRAIFAYSNRVSQWHNREVSCSVRMVDCQEMEEEDPRDG